MNLPRDPDEPPELAFAHDPDDDPYGEGPYGDGRPGPGERRRRALRVVVVVALVALIAPIVLSTAGVAQASAARSCALLVAGFDRDADGSRVAFDLFARGGPGWLCSAVTGDDERPIANLGLIPGAPPPDPDPEDLEVET